MVFICAESELSHCWYSGYTQCSVSSRGSFQEYFLSAWAAGAGCWVMDWKWPHVSSAMLHSRSVLENLFQIVPCLDNWQFRLNCMTAAFRAELLLNLMSACLHKMRLFLSKMSEKFECFCNQEFQQKYRDQTVHGEKVKCTFLNDILLDCRFYFIHVAFLFLLKHRLQAVHKILRHKPLS